MILFTSDLHFHHPAMAQKRGFVKLAPGPDGAWIEVGDTVAHDAYIVSRWNSFVRPDDTVWVLGDVGFGRIVHFADSLAQLNGKLELVPGNHDEPWPGNRDAYKHQATWLHYFHSIQAFARLRINRRVVLLSHFPYELDHTDPPRALQYRLRDYGEILLHGHLHRDPPVTVHGHEIHVGLDMWSLAPVTLTTIEGCIRAIQCAEASRGES